MSQDQFDLCTTEVKIRFPEHGLTVTIAMPGADDPGCGYPGVWSYRVENVHGVIASGRYRLLFAATHMEAARRIRDMTLTAQRHTRLVEHESDGLRVRAAIPAGTTVHVTVDGVA